MVNLRQHSIESEAGKAEVADAIQAWISLKNAQWNNREQRPALENILKILRFVGLQCDSRGITGDSTRSRRSGPARRELTVELDQEGIVPQRGFPPQFGSDSNGVYDVVCTWNYSPHAVTSLSTVTRSARNGQRALIVFYFGGLTKPARNEIRTNCIRDNLSFALLDEILFEFLATVDRQSRFETFIKCALAYSAPNPYIPEDRLSEAVPPEMFYGRESIAADIEYGSTHFLFGGRQVGKTALLRHIRRRGNDREGRRFTWFIDLKAEGYISGAADKDPMAVWEMLLRLFKEDGLLGEDPSEVPSESIPGLLGGTIQQDGRLRVLILLDESDRFLELDMDSGSRVVEAMRSLMRDTNDRFKVVFAGLHSVQRFALTRRENTPFYSFGFDPSTPRRGGLGPFKYDEAQRLVVEPMRAIGIEFESPLLVDTILTHTECHPAEIQFFCHRLVALLRESGILDTPPYSIRQNHVDEVANSEHIRKGIRRRYEVTFELDERYRAISLSMIHHYHGPESPALEPLSVSAVRDLVRDLIQNDQIWDNFDESRLSDVELESLLNELVGLGILVKHGTGYRVRSQRIARVFGRSEDVIDEIVKISEGR